MIRVASPTLCRKCRFVAPQPDMEDDRCTYPAPWTMPSISYCSVYRGLVGYDVCGASAKWFEPKEASA